MRRLIIERAAIRSNMAVIKERAQKAALYGVVAIAFVLVFCVAFV